MGAGARHGRGVVVSGGADAIAGWGKWGRRPISRSMRMRPTPIVRVSRSMGWCCASHHLHPSFASRVRWACALPAPAPPVVRVSRSMGVCCASHHLHLSLASADRWGCALPATTSTLRSRLAIDGGVLCQPPAPPVVHVSHSMGVCCASHQPHPSFASRVRWGCAVRATTSTFRWHLLIDGGVLCQPPAPPVVRVWRSMGVCCASHQLHLSFASRDRWGCAVRATTSTLRLHLPIDGGVLCQPPPPPVVRISRSMGVSCASIVRVSRSMRVCFASHQLHPSRSMGVSCASHHLPSFASGARWMFALPAISSSRRSRLAFDGGVLCRPSPPPVVRWVCYGFLSFASRVLCGCGMPLSTSTRRSRPTRRVHPVRG